MSNFSDFFPGSSATGGGGGVQSSVVFTSNGTWDPSAAGLSIGSKIRIFALGGGQGGYDWQYGGDGGGIDDVLIELTSTDVLDITIGTGGAGKVGANPATNGGTTTVIQSGTTLATGLGGGSTGNYNGGSVISSGVYIITAAQGRGYGQFGWGGRGTRSGVASSNGVSSPRSGYGQGGPSNGRQNRVGADGSSGRVEIHW